MWPDTFHWHSHHPTVIASVACVTHDCYSSECRRNFDLYACEWPSIGSLVLLLDLKAHRHPSHYLPLRSESQRLHRHDLLLRYQGYHLVPPLDVQKKISLRHSTTILHRLPLLRPLLLWDTQAHFLTFAT